MTNSLPHDRIAKRVKALREAKGLTQEELAVRLGFKDRQTLSAIEAGTRRITPTELVAISSELATDLDELLDPFRLVGEGRFSFRTTPDFPSDQLEVFANKAGCWVATFRELGNRAGVTTPPLAHRLDLSRESSFEEAQFAGESLWKAWRLGEVPASQLQEAIARELGVLVLYVDAPLGLSGAASRLAGLQSILVNRNEPACRRSYDLAHELFHVLTWDAMPPERVEGQEIKSTKGNRIEQLANNFAAALLMPEPIVAARWSKKKEEDFSTWVLSTAKALMVSVTALQWRLVSLKIIAKSAIQRLLNDQGDHNAPPFLFSAPFVERIYEAVEAGQLSLRRAASLLDLSIHGLLDLSRSYGKPLSYDMRPA